MPHDRLITIDDDDPTPHLTPQSPTEGDVLTIVSGEPEFAAATGGITELDDVPDVNAPSPAVDEVLTWDGSEWVAQAVSATAPTLTTPTITMGSASSGTGNVTPTLPSHQADDIL